VKVYLDTNLIGSNRDQDAEEAKALTHLEARPEIEWCISQRVSNEIERHRDKEAQALLKLATNSIARVKTDHQVVGFQTHSDYLGGMCAFPLVTDAADRGIFESLTQIGLTRVDAQHLTNAIYNKCEVFLTRDKKTILKFRDKICALYPDIRIYKPSEFWHHFDQESLFDGNHLAKPIILADSSLIP